MMDQGMTLVDEDMMIDGLIITDTDDHNIEQSQQAMCNYAKTDPNLRTMYIQSYDGRYGFRLYFDSTCCACTAYCDTRKRIHMKTLYFI